MKHGWIVAAATTVVAHSALAVLPLRLDRAKARRRAPEPLTLTLSTFKAPALQPQRPPAVAPAPAKSVIAPRRRQVVHRRVRRPTPAAKPVEAVAPRPEPAPDDRAEKTPPVAKQGAVDLRGYGRTLFAAIIAERRYPKIARRLGLQGRVLLRLRLTRDGRLLHSKVIRSSGHRALDQEAQRMVRAAAPYAALPAGFSKASATIVVPVRFRLRI